MEDLPTRLRELKLRSFRNYDDLTLVLSGDHVVFTGPNGAGKTNLLEAISFLSPGRGLRRAVYEDVSLKGSSEGFSIFAELDADHGEVSIGTGTFAQSGSKEDGAGRRLRINGANARSSEDLLDHLRVLWLTPAMDGLFTGSAGDRRRFFDRLVLAIDPGHARRTVEYDKAMRSRNRLLSEGRLDPTWLDGIEWQMAELGTAIHFARVEIITLLSRLIADNQADSPFPVSTLDIPDTLDFQEMIASDAEGFYAGKLRDGRVRDAAAGRTLYGPHRADILVRHRDKDIEAARASTGEQKALLTGLVLAHARLVRNLTGHAPFLLLDEIAAHLDGNRRRALFDLVDALGGQAFMTGTDRELFTALEDRAQFFEVCDGSVISDK